MKLFKILAQYRPKEYSQVSTFTTYMAFNLFLGQIQITVYIKTKERKGPNPSLEPGVKIQAEREWMFIGLSHLQ